MWCGSKTNCQTDSPILSRFSSLNPAFTPRRFKQTKGRVVLHDPRRIYFGVLDWRHPRGGRRVLQAPTLALALLVTAANADTLTDADVQGFYAFDQKAVTMLQDITERCPYILGIAPKRVPARPRRPTYISGLGV
jgi:hypothetical protein